MDNNNTIPEVDLNLRHYIGNRSDVIKDVLMQIKNYLRCNKITASNRVIYSAIYNALLYYQNISDLSISGESSEKTFLENTIKLINDDYNFLADKYNIKNLDEINRLRAKENLEPIPQVIQVKCRVKSPVSAMEKIKSKVEEYVKTGRDLSRLNESLRDFIGIRFIINAPPEIKAQGKKAESDFCYKVFQDLTEHHGILRQLNNESLEDDFDFIPVNTDHDPHKLQKLKDRAINKEFEIDPEKEGVYIPTSRPKFMEIIDKFVKDYRMFPKPKLYQRMHICAHPHYAKKSIQQITLPKYIIKPKSNKPALEYQVCTGDEEWWCEYGKAPHKQYKDRTFHRLGIPLLINLDKDKNKVRLNRLDECMKEFYGYDFQDMFGMDYQEFLHTFDTEQCNEVLAGLKEIVFNEKTQEYELKHIERTFILQGGQKIDFVKNLLKNSSKEELQRFYEANGINNNTIYPKNLKERKRICPKIKVYEFCPSVKNKSKKQTPPKNVFEFDEGPEQ